MGVLRHMKTTQEIRANVGLEIDARIEAVKVRIRAARSKHNLPNAWDDFFPSLTKNWKDYRKTQHR